MGEFRLQRASKIIQEELGNLILSEKIKDPGINKLIYVSQVIVSKDVGYAKVFISGSCSEKQIEKSVEALNRAAGFVQSVIGKKLKTRLTPRLTFIYDSSIRDGFEINRLIEEKLN